MDIRDLILAKKDLVPVKVSVPEWGMDVYVRPLSGADRDAFESEIIASGKRTDNIRGRLAARSLCDESGTRLFNDVDAKALGEKSASALDKIVAAVQKLNALGEQEVKELGEP